MNFLEHKSSILDLQAKMQEIVKLPLFPGEDNYNGLVFEHNGIYIKTYIRIGDNYNYNSFLITWDDVDQPLDYFKNKFIELNKAEKRITKRITKRSIKHKQQKQENRDLQDYMRIKYGIDIK